MPWAALGERPPKGKKTLQLCLPAQTPSSQVIWESLLTSILWGHTPAYWNQQDYTGQRQGKKILWPQRDWYIREVQTRGSKGFWREAAFWRLSWLIKWPGSMLLKVMFSLLNLFSDFLCHCFGFCISVIILLWDPAINPISTWWLGDDLGTSELHPSDSGGES